MAVMDERERAEIEFATMLAQSVVSQLIVRDQSPTFRVRPGWHVQDIPRLVEQEYAKLKDTDR